MWKIMRYSVQKKFVRRNRESVSFSKRYAIGLDCYKGKEELLRVVERQRYHGHLKWFQTHQIN